MAVDLEKSSFEQADSAPQTTTPTPSNTPNPDSIVINPLIQVIHGNTANSFSSTFSSVFNWMEKLFERLINSEGINVKIKPLTAIAIAVAFTVGGGIVGGVIVSFFRYQP